MEKNYANKRSPPIFKPKVRKWGGIKLPLRVDFLPANVSKPRQRFFDSVVPFNLLLVECKTTGFGQMLLFFFNIRHEIFWSKNDPLCRRQKLLSPRRVDFLLTHLSKPRHCFFYSVVRFNLLLIECKITRFGLLHPTKNSKPFFSIISSLFG